MDGWKFGLLYGLWVVLALHSRSRPTLCKGERETLQREKTLAQGILNLKDLSIIHGLTPIQEGLNLQSLEV